MFALVFTYFLPINVLAAANYVVNGSLLINGLHVDASGTLSANTFTGQASQQHASVNWDFNGSGSWTTFMNEADFNFTDSGNNGIIASTPWSTSHTYSTPGTYTIKVVLHHASVNGNESGSQVFEQTVEITYQCSDGTDNDGDGLIDSNDPGCTGEQDDDEFNEIPPPVLGCTDPEATNYNPNATQDDGSCQYPPAPVLGCTNPDATNYNPNATQDDGSCILPVLGCMNPSATNYNPLATQDDGSCVFPPEPVPGCTDPTALNYNPNANEDDGSCTYPILGCTNPNATNYNPAATPGNVDADACTFPPAPILGCTDPEATNYNPEATQDDESCTYPPEPPVCDIGFHLVENECVPDQQAPTDVCANIEGVQESVPQGYHQEGENCVADSTPEPTPPSNPSQPETGPNLSGGRRHDISGLTGGGEVLGASTLGEACGLYMDKFIRSGTNNDTDQVSKLQTFLNKHLGSNLPITGV
ncbi:MAG: hypothetical protein AAB392_01415, partial [Patescibacteria group bacterium]